MERKSIDLYKGLVTELEAMLESSKVLIGDAKNLALSIGKETYEGRYIAGVRKTDGQYEYMAFIKEVRGVNFNPGVGFVLHVKGGGYAREAKNGFDLAGGFFNSITFEERFELDKDFNVVNPGLGLTLTFVTKDDWDALEARYHDLMEKLYDAQGVHLFEKGDTVGYCEDGIMKRGTITAFDEETGVFTVGYGKDSHFDEFKGYVTRTGKELLSVY